jgi:predicted aspartyl protease
MGITYIDGKVVGPTGKQEEIRFLVDSGATFSLIPQVIWQTIELVPKKKMVFTFADGSSVERDISECYIILPQGEAHTPVILGEADDEALLGIVTLEILGLILNPFKRILQPMKMMLA